MIKLKKLAEIFDHNFHKSYAFSWDNSGLLIGNLGLDIKTILIALDLDNSIIEEAIKLKANLIFTHHPLIFNPIKYIVSNDILGQKILRLIENKIAVYCAHTNFDLMTGGLNDYICSILEMKNIKTVFPESLKWFKFVVFVPLEYEEKIREVICMSGGGLWKNYSCATFKTIGEGTFKPEDGAKPFIGEVGNLSFVKEAKIECIVSQENLNNLIKNVLKNHPYEEPAFDIFPIENKFEIGGIGKIGNLKKALNLNEFLIFLKQKLNLKNFRYIYSANNCKNDNYYNNSEDYLKNSKKNDEIKNDEIKIQKIALINGSVNSVVENLKYLDFDTLICGEISYHNAQEISEFGKVVIEIGHAESEIFAVNHIFNLLNDINQNENLNLNIIKSKNNSSLWRYLIE